jgi:UDPglucose 6-dehydrogenase
MQKIVIAGYGPVGQAVEAALFKHAGVDLYIDDPYKGYNYDPNFGDPVDGVIVCVATPMNDAGFCERKNVEAVFEKYGYVKYLIKSAVTPDILETNDHFDITVSPEFLASSNSNRSPTDEFLNQTFAIYGGGSMRYWHELFKPVLPNLKEVKFCSRDQAAFAKYVENNFLAMKVTFWNQMYEIYNAMGYEDFDVMVDAIGVDPRIGTSHSQVPGPDGKQGFGGHCLPKDVNALMNMGKYNGADVDFLESMLRANDKYRGENNGN